MIFSCKKVGLAFRYAVIGNMLLPVFKMNTYSRVAVNLLAF